MNIETIAKVIHEVNSIYCQTLKDFSHAPWEETTEELRRCTKQGIQFYIDNPNVSRETSHWNWIQQKVKEGWVYGNKKDRLKKTHPCILGYDELPRDQKVKDTLFLSICKVLVPEL